MYFPSFSAAAVLVGTLSTPNAVRMNQLGFLPAAPHRAMLNDPSTQPLRWQLVDGAGRALSQGSTTVFGADPTSGEHVHRVEFAAPAGSGYSLKVAGRTSRPFAVSPDIYNRLRHDALNYFYQTRASIPIEARYAGGAQWARPAGHLPDLASCVAGTDTRGNHWSGCKRGKVDVSGGWYDAGDQGKYVVNGGISVWTLLNFYERQRALGRASAFADGKARIPESGNGVNDLLDEARWELEFFLRMQVPDGTHLQLPRGQKREAAGLRFADVDASGLVYHKVGDEEWTTLPTPPAEDRQKRVLAPPTTAATLNFAATTAQCARIWRTIDPAFSRRCLVASERAWAAAVRNPGLYAVAAFPGSGAYGDEELSDEFYWAAAELFITTGSPVYRSTLQKSRFFSATAAPEFGWPSVATLGTISLALVPNQLAARQSERLRGSLVNAANGFLAEEARTGYQIPYAPEGWPWGSTSSILNRAIILGLAHDFTGAERYRTGVIDAMDFVLGRNPLDRSFVTGTGARPMQNPHHRFWTRQLDPKQPGPPPGIISGGPNSTSKREVVADPLKPGCAPAMCWMDDAREYTVNEVAINWNAPLVWTSAWLAERKER